MSNFELLLFSNNVPFVKAAATAGLDGVIIDREYIGKSHRQQDLDTQINQHTFDDLTRIQQATDLKVFCRINNIPEIRTKEAKQAVQYGANEIFLPMVRNIDEIYELLEILDGQAGLGILIETDAAIAIAKEVAQLPLSYVYVGLNDLALERSMSNIFENVYNGTVESIREYFHNIPFGFGGLTVPPYGNPIPTILLMGEMMRLDCNFVFLRQSFLRDVSHDYLQDAIPIIKSELANMRKRTKLDIEKQHKELLTCIHTMSEV